MNFSPEAAKKIGAIGAIGGGLHGLLHPKDENPIEAAIKNALIYGIITGITGGMAIGTGKTKLMEFFKKKI